MVMQAAAPAGANSLSDLISFHRREECACQVRCKERNALWKFSLRSRQALIKQHPALFVCPYTPHYNLTEVMRVVFYFTERKVDEFSVYIPPLPLLWWSNVVNLRPLILKTKRKLNNVQKKDKSEILRPKFTLKAATHLIFKLRYGLNCKDKLTIIAVDMGSSSNKLKHLSLFCNSKGQLRQLTKL
jgi:hypothetical protein